MIGIFYLIGVAIVIVFLTLFVGWAIANDDKLDEDIDLLSSLIMIPILSLTSWLFIFVLLASLMFEYIKDKK